MAAGRTGDRLSLARASLRLLRGGNARHRPACGERECGSAAGPDAARWRPRPRSRLALSSRELRRARDRCCPRRLPRCRLAASRALCWGVASARSQPARATLCCRRASAWRPRLNPARALLTAAVARCLVDCRALLPAAAARGPPDPPQPRRQGPSLQPIEPPSPRPAAAARRGSMGRSRSPRRDRDSRSYRSRSRDRRPSERGYSERGYRDRDRSRDRYTPRAARRAGMVACLAPGAPLPAAAAAPPPAPPPGRRHGCAALRRRRRWGGARVAAWRGGRAAVSSHQLQRGRGGRAAGRRSARRGRHARAGGAASRLGPCQPGLPGRLNHRHRHAPPPPPGQHAAARGMTAGLPPGARPAGRAGGARAPRRPRSPPRWPRPPTGTTARAPATCGAPAAGIAGGRRS
jgi:hypothetical protein